MTDSRREEALETALALFVRYGYRKTSMDEVARAVGLSRQGLYLWFPNKKALFTEMTLFMMRRLHTEVDAALSAEGPIETRVVAGFVAAGGLRRVPGMTVAAMDELLETAVQLVGEPVLAFERELLQRIARELEPYAGGGLTALELADVLMSVSYGLKHRTDGGEAYEAGLERAVRLVCRTHT